MDVAIIGGTGAEGFGLTLRLAKAGHHVTIGSRDAARADAKAGEARGILGADAQVSGAENPAAAAAAPVVIVTVPFEGAAAIYGSIAGSVTPETVVCDCTSPLMASVGGRASHALHPWHGSAAEFVRTLLPHGTRLVAGFHTVSAKALAKADEPLDEDVILCGDDEEAKAVVAALAERLVEGRAVDAGRLEVARWLEPLTAVLLNVNRRYKVSSGVKVTGLP